MKTANMWENKVKCSVFAINTKLPVVSTLAYKTFSSNTSRLPGVALSLTITGLLRLKLKFEA